MIEVTLKGSRITGVVGGDIHDIKIRLDKPIATVSMLNVIHIREDPNTFDGQIVKSKADVALLSAVKAGDREAFVDALIEGAYVHVSDEEWKRTPRRWAEMLSQKTGSKGYKEILDILDWLEVKW